MKIRTTYLRLVRRRCGRTEYRYVLFGALILVAAVAVAQEDTLRAQQETMDFKPLLQVLDSQKLLGSLEYRGRCTTNHFPDFPEFKPHSSVSHGPTLEVLSKMFEKDANVSVVENSGGIVRMRQDDVPTDLLDVRIGHVAFGGGASDIYNPNEAIQIILGTPEVVLFMRQHSMQLPSAAGSVPGGMGHGAEDGTRLTGEMNHATVREALDHVLQTFGGIWIYQVCPDRSAVYIHFYYLKKFGSILIVQS